MKKTILTVLTTLLAAYGLAQGPNNSGTYYQAANGKSGQALKTALFNIISEHDNVGYDGLIEAYKQTDKRPDGYLRDWYSNATNYTWSDRNGNSSEGAGWNREHSVPQSWFNKANPMKSDIVHVLPTDCYVNGRRGSYPFGEVGTTTYTSKNGYSKLGSCKTPGYSGTVFEPNDEIKGDIARIYFYMATCYEDKITSWSGGVFTGTKYQPMAQWTYDMMVRWSKQDPVDEVERARNNAVYTVQKNRNPFVDYPGLEEYVWGSKKSQAFNYSNYEGGSGEVITTVAQPVFSPNGGTFTDKVMVSMDTETDGAEIYFTTNGVDASENSICYAGPIEVTETTTLKAIAVKNGVKSYQTVATFTITNVQGQEQPAEGTILLNNALFGTSYSGSINSSETQDLTGTQNGVTVVYSLGDGSNRYCNDSQIRLYQKNRLTISVASGTINKLEFVLAAASSKTLSASTGTVNDLIWTGNASSVTFNVNDGSGNMQLSSVKVTLSGTQGINQPKGHMTADGDSFRTLSGTVVDRHHLRPGIYIHKGKKVIVK